MTLKDTLLMLSIALMWGLSAFLDKLALNKLGNLGVTLLLAPTIPSAIIFVILLFISTKLGISQMGVLLTSLSWLLTTVGSALYYLLLMNLTVGITTTIVMITYPIIALLLSLLFLGETLTTIQLVGAVISLFGAYLILK